VRWHVEVVTLLQEQNEVLPNIFMGSVPRLRDM